MITTERARFNRELFLAVDRMLIEELKARARRAPDATFRFCLHSSEKEPVQEMLVVSGRTATRPPHRHPRSTETHLMIEGEILVLLFDARGRIRRRVALGPPGSTKPFCARVGPNRWHMIVFLSQPVVYYEVMRGPFVTARSNIWAHWGPTPGDSRAMREYLRKLRLA
ncbi:MAG: WbuC family cupin fold metalloprotein [Kiritimatiellia bacterium]